MTTITPSLPVHSDPAAIATGRSSASRHDRPGGAAVGVAPDAGGGAIPDPPGLITEIETVLGYRPCSSVALRVRRPTRSCAIIRVDLPPVDDRVVSDGGPGRVGAGAGASGVTSTSGVAGFTTSTSAGGKVSRSTSVASANAGASAIAELGRAITGLLARVPGADAVDIVAYGPPVSSGGNRGEAVGGGAVAGAPGRLHGEPAGGDVGAAIDQAVDYSIHSEVAPVDDDAVDSAVDRAVVERLRAVVDGVERALGRAGFFHGRSLIVSGDRWAPAHVCDSVDAARGTEGADSAKSVGGAMPRWHPLPTAGSPGGRRPDPHRGPFVPIPSASERRRTRALAALAELQRPGVGREPDPIDLLLRWQSVLALSAPPPSDARCIALAWSLRHKIVRDCVLMQCAWGLDAGLLALSDLVTAAPAQNPPSTPSASPAACQSPSPSQSAPASAWVSRGDKVTGGRMPAPAPGPGVGAGAGVDETDSGVATSFLGIGDVAPRPAMLRKSIDVLRGIAEVAPETLRPAPLTMLAWLEWSRGRGTAAARYLDAALAADPDYLLAHLFQQLLAGGATPLWLDPAAP